MMPAKAKLEMTTKSAEYTDSPHPASATLSPSDGERDGVRGLSELDQLSWGWRQCRFIHSIRTRKQVAPARAHAGQSAEVLKHFARVKQCIVTLDMEGVLTPEIWIAVAEKTKIPELRRTTRDEPDYDKLMRQRIAILDRHGIKPVSYTHLRAHETL